jgi:hypothetical protein
VNPVGLQVVPYQDVDDWSSVTLALIIMITPFPSAREGRTDQTPLRARVKTSVYTVHCCAIDRFAPAGEDSDGDTGLESPEELTADMIAELTSMMDSASKQLKEYVLERVTKHYDGRIGYDTVV